LPRTLSALTGDLLAPRNVSRIFSRKASTFAASAKKLPPNKALAARQLGQLVAAARQVVGIEEWTSVSTIRKVVTDYGRLDGGNFAATIQQMADNVAVIRGKGQSREVKITKPGLEATADLIKGLAGVEG